MRRIEIISIRCTSHKHDEVKDALTEFLETATGPRPRVRLFGSVAAPTDLSVHIDTTGTQKTEGESPIGIHMANMLRRFGLVNHDVWTEIEMHEIDTGEGT